MANVTVPKKLKFVDYNKRNGVNERCVTLYLAGRAVACYMDAPAPSHIGTEWTKLGDSECRFDYSESNKELGVYLREWRDSTRYVAIVKINKFQVKAVCQAMWEELVEAEATDKETFEKVLTAFCEANYIACEGVFID